MKNKSVLTLIELTVMFLVFALAAAICIQAFAQADRISKTSAARDNAIAEAQNVAERLQQYAGDSDALIKMYGGYATDMGWQISYDQNWQPAQESGRYRIEVEMEPGKAEITVIDTQNGEVLAGFPVGWQEET